MKKVCCLLFCFFALHSLSAVAENRFYIPDLNMVPGETIDVSIMLDNDVTDFSSFQADIWLPEGLEFVQQYDEEYEEYYIFSLTARAHKRMSIASAIQSDGTMRLMLTQSLGTSIQTISGTSGALVTFKLKAADNTSGTKYIMLQNIVFTTASSTQYDIENCMTKVTINVPATGISLNKTSLSFTGAGQTATLTATVIPSNATNKDVTWSSSDTAVATVSSTGVVTAVANGTAVITATTADGTNLSASCEVKVVIDASAKIVFADANVKALCVQNWDTNGDGELGETEAAEVTSIVTVFRSNTTITSFDELQYFTGLTAIEDFAFASCNNLKSVTIPNSVTSLGHSAFEGCSSLASVDLPGSVTTIENLAFSKCSALTSVNFPNAVEYIGYEAFSYCTALTSVLIPSSVTFIGNHNNGAFKGCTSLTSIVVENGNTVYDSRDNCNAIIETSSNTLICGCSNTMIPTTVVTIGEGAFSVCKNLTSLVIPSSVTTIGANAFNGCTGLASITLPSSLTRIGNSAFYGCKSLTAVAIPNSVAQVGNEVFSHCSGLTSISIPESMTTIPSGMFAYCDGLTSVTIPNWVEYINGGFDNCSGLKTVFIPKSVTAIEDYTFYGCNNLTAVYVEWDEPISLNSSDVFTNYSNATLFVPKGTKALYEAADYWKDFKEIVERSGSAINNISELSNNKLYMLTTGQDVLSVQDKAVWVNSIINDADHKGLVTDASQLSSPWTEPTEGSLEALLDGNTETFWHSNWSDGAVAGHTHYLQVDLVEPVSENICMVFTRRNAENDHITQWDVFGSNAPDGSWIEIARISTPYNNKYETLTSYAFDTFGFRYLRFYIDDTTGEGNGTRGYGHLSEFRLYKASEVGTGVQDIPTPNEKNQFAILSINGKYYLYSPALHAYYMIDTQFIPGYGSAFTIEDGQTGDDYRWTLSAMMNKNNCVLGSQVKITATADFDPTKALAAFTENVDLGLADGYYRIRNARVFTNTVTDSDGSEKEVQVYKYACSTTDTEGNLYGSWCTPDTLDTDCPSLWKLTKRNGLYDLQNMYTNSRFTTIDQIAKTMMSEESESLIAIDRVTEVDGVKYVNIRIASQPMADYNYLHTGGHENGKGINGEIVGWCNTGIYGNSEWILEPVDKAQAEAIINSYHKKTGDVNRDGLITIADVTALVNIILGKDSVEPYQYDHRAADVNKDSSITIADVTALVNIILGKN